MTTMLLSPRPSQLDRDAFIASYGEIYEHSPWIAAQSWDTHAADTWTHDPGLRYLKLESTLKSYIKN